MNPCQRRSNVNKLDCNYMRSFLKYASYPLGTLSVLALLCTAADAQVALGGSGNPTASEARSTQAFGTNSWLAGSLRGRIYFLKPETQRLPDLSSMRPVGTIYTHKLDVPTREWMEGFPGVSRRFEWFAIEYEGVIQAHRTGRYSLRLVSDDGSRLYIDDQLIIDNDGIHATRSAEGSVDLDVLPHKIRIQYFQGPRFFVALQLFCGSERGGEQLFPNCGVGLETPDKPAYTTTITYHMEDISEKISFSRKPCLVDLDVCTPERAIIENKGRGRYHVILPADLVWGAIIPNPTHGGVTVGKASGKTCDLTIDPSVGCNEWQGSTERCLSAAWKYCYFRSAGEGFLSPNEKPRALIHQTVGGITRFSVNGNSNRVLRNHAGVSEFKDYYGSIEFDVEIAQPNLTDYGTGTSAPALGQQHPPALPIPPVSPSGACYAANDGQWHKVGVPRCRTGRPPDSN
jgi:hypothetical protein